MKVNEIEFNGKIYRIVKASNDAICETCALKDHCDNTTQEGDEIYQICQSHPFIVQFKEINNIVSIKENFKFYTFSSGAVFNTNYIKDIIDIGYVETCPIELDKHSFSVLLSNKLTIHFRFDTKTIATRERNKFIKFIERYGYTNNSN